jgi:hypothetical protein
LRIAEETGAAIELGASSARCRLKRIAGTTVVRSGVVYRPTVTEEGEATRPNSLSNAAVPLHAIFVRMFVKRNARMAGAKVVVADEDPVRIYETYSRPIGRAFGIAEACVLDDLNEAYSSRDGVLDSQFTGYNGSRHQQATIGGNVEEPYARIQSLIPYLEPFQFDVAAFDKIDARPTNIQELENDAEAAKCS